MCRSLALALVIVACAFIEASPAQATVRLIDPAAEPQAETKSDCNLPSLICTGGEIVGDIGDAVTGGIGDAVATGANAAASAAMNGVVAWASEGSAWLVTQIVKEIERSTRPELDQKWFTQRYHGMVALAAVLAAIFLLAAVGQAIVAQDVSRLLRAVFVQLPCAMLMTFVTVTLTQLGLRVTDEMTAWVLRGTGQDVHEAFRALGAILSLTNDNSYAAPFVVFLNAVLISVVALIVWLELVMREAAVYVALAFLPLTLIAMVWERTAHWSRRLAEWLVAIVLAKFTIAAAFALAASAITGGLGDDGGVSTVLAGSAVLLIAALTPWALLKLIPFAETAAGNLSRSHVKGAATAVPGVQTGTSVVRQMAMMRFGAAMSGSGSRGSAVAANVATSMPQSATSASPPSAGGSELPQLPDKRPVRPKIGGSR